MGWIRQYFVTLLFSGLLALHAVLVAMQFIVLDHLKSIRQGVWNAPRYAAETISSNLEGTVVKVAICDVEGKACASTSVAKVTTTPNMMRRSPSDPTVLTMATYGLIVTNPERP